VALIDRRRDSIVRIAEVKRRTGLSVATIYRRAEAGTFPKRIRLGPRSVGWYQSDIDDFVAAPADYRVPEADPRRLSATIEMLADCSEEEMNALLKLASDPEVKTMLRAQADS
jgi:prophage regulatory protein